MADYFIADLHLGHKNCIRFDNRPFEDIQEHDNVIITNWNATVKKDDDVYILGDVTWHNAQKTIEILQRLNGAKHLIKGNHDGRMLKSAKLRDEFVEITDYKELKLDDNKGIVLCHYPIPCFKNHYYNWYHLYGHVHVSTEWKLMEKVKQEMEEKYKFPCKMYNVGCMVQYMNYTPKTLEEILEGANA